METQKIARVYRFHDQIALSFTDTETLYLTPEMAEGLAKELNVFVKHSKGESWPVTRLVNHYGNCFNESGGEIAHRFLP